VRRSQGRPAGRWQLLAAGLVLVLASGCASRDAAPAANNPASAGPGSTGSPSAGSSPSAALERLAACPASTATAPAGHPLELTLPCLGAGPEVRLSGLAGTPTVLTLWGSWCAPCYRELPRFQRLHEQAGQQLRVLGVNDTDRPQGAADAVRELGLTFPSVVDETGTVRRALGRTGMPHTVFLRADGSVAHVRTGEVREVELAALVERHLGLALAPR